MNNNLVPMEATGQTKNKYSQMLKTKKNKTAKKIQINTIKKCDILLCLYSLYKELFKLNVQY